MAQPHPKRSARWVGCRGSQHCEAALAALLAVEGPRSTENTLRLFDAALEHLSLAGAQSGVLNSVAAEKPVRDQAQMEAQRVAMTGSALSLNRGVYDALVAMNIDARRSRNPAFCRAHPARLSSGWRRQGRAHPRTPQEAPRKSHRARPAIRPQHPGRRQDHLRRHASKELDGLPPDDLGRHQPDAGGQSTLTTDQPDIQPLMTVASNADLRQRMVIAYNTRAYPDNKQILLDLLATRQEIASVLGFRSWADLATADQMMGSAANVRKFLARLEEASREGAVREHELVLEFVRTRQAGIKAIDITSRGYWYEQFRRSAFDFDSQSVRPYFPYQRVEAGVLETAAKLFKIEFRRSDAQAWDPAVSVFDVHEEGRHVGRFYLDMHPREGKDKWFSAAPVVTGVPWPSPCLKTALISPNFPESDLPTIPACCSTATSSPSFTNSATSCTPSSEGRPLWAGVSGFATEADFIEVPSQMLEGILPR